MESAYRNVENQLCLQTRQFEAAMMQPGFFLKKDQLLANAQNTYWGALLTLPALPQASPEQLAPVQFELRRLRSTLNAFKK